MIEQPTARAGAYWPTRLQRALLRAALLDGPNALAAWREWREDVDVDVVDVGSQRLLPLLSHNMRRLGLSDVDLGRFKGLQRFTWAANQRRFQQITPFIAACRAGGVPVMLLKGMALAMRYYPNVGLRPMEDVDLLVHRADAPRALDILAEQQWAPLGAVTDLDFGHARSFHQAGCQLDLHWHAQWEFTTASDEDVWANASTMTVGDVPVNVISSTDLLLQIIAHGCRWNSVPPIRWIADALLVLRHDELPVDWRRFVTRAQQLELILPIRIALSYLVQEFGAPVPAHVVNELEASRPSAFERVEQRMREWTSPAVGCFPLVLCHHVRMTRDAGVLAVGLRLPRYLKHTYELPSMRALPAALYAKATRRLRDATSQS